MITNARKRYVVERDELIDNIENEFDGICVYDVSSSEAINDFTNIVDMTTHEAIYDWTPVEDDLPNDCDSCLVTLKNHTVTKAWYNGNFWANNTSKYLKTVIAWKPYPEPYMK